MHRHQYLETVVGKLCIVENEEKITHLLLPGETLKQGSEEEETPLLRLAKEQLLEYFRGERNVFSLPLAPSGTEFQRKVWNALLEIPWGQTRSYKSIAERVGCPKGARAVGMANNRNPIAILIPCHRVIGTKGDLVGYGGGLECKQRLLEIESRIR